MAPHSSTLAWKIPWTEEPDRLQSMGLLRPTPLALRQEPKIIWWYKGAMEKAMAPHSSTLAWKIPWTEEPDRLQSMGSLRVRHN